MIGRKSALGIYCVLSFGLLYGKSYAGTVKRPSRMVREVYPEIEQESEGNQAQVCIVGDVVYGMDEAVPAEQPCLKCKCQAPGVQCETIQCVKRPGCKAIHKPNKCCPDYQCECEYNGKFYANGEKLETSPGGECKVCYCRGGEVQCAEVSCYIRKDCEGKRVPGTCCPKYDHCPPIDPSSNRLPYTTEIIVASANKDEVEPWLITSLSSNSTENIYAPTASDFQDENKIPDTNYYEVTTPSVKSIDTENFQSDAAVLPRITIQEIIPERKEIPVTAPPKIETESQGTLVIEEAEVVDNSNDLVVTDSDIESSEVSEVFHRPPPVLRVGDKLLFLNKGEFVHDNESSTPDSVITVVGAEGLQRGFEDSGEVHEQKIDHFPDAENISTEFPATEVNSTILIDENKDLNDLLLNTAASTHIFSVVKRKDKETGTTQSTIEASKSTTDYFEMSKPSTESEQITTVPSNPHVLSEAVLINATEVTNIETNNKHDQGMGSVTRSPTQNNVTDEIVVEQNPAYPPIPDILSPNNMDDTSQRFDVENGDKEYFENRTISESKILPEVLDKRSNKTVPQNITRSDWLKKKKNPNTLINVEATLPDELLNQPAPIDFQDNFNATDELAVVTGEEEFLSTTEIAPKKITKLQGSEETFTKSVEVVENSNEESGESTTPKSKNAAIISSENASVESEGSSEVNDMVETDKKPENDNTEEIVTVPNVKLIDRINESHKNDSVLKTDDVEIIDTTILQKDKPIIPKSIAASTSIPEFLPKPEKLISKRETSSSEESQEIFKDLEKEISNEQTERYQSSEEEQKESEAIFKELLEDTSTPRSHNKDKDALATISEALTQSSLRSGGSNANILGVLSSFLRSESRQFK